MKSAKAAHAHTMHIQPLNNGDNERETCHMTAQILHFIIHRPEYFRRAFLIVLYAPTTRPGRGTLNSRALSVARPKWSYNLRYEIVQSMHRLVLMHCNAIAANSQQDVQSTNNSARRSDSNRLHASHSSHEVHWRLTIGDFRRITAFINDM